MAGGAEQKWLRHSGAADLTTYISQLAFPSPSQDMPPPSPGFWTWKSNPHLLERCRQHMVLGSLVLLVGSSVPQTCSHPEQATCF